MDVTLLLTKVTLLFVCALGLGVVLRRSTAVARHRLWSSAFAAALALPVLASVLRVDISVPTEWRDTQALTTIVDAPLTLGGHSSIGARLDSIAAQPRLLQPATNAAPLPGQPDATQVLAAVWVAGLAAALSAIVVSLLRVRGLARSSDEITDPAWCASAAAIGVQLGLRARVRLVEHAHACSPMAGGLLQPVVLLPPSARDWSAERRDIVLTHELAHLAGHDPLRHVLARVALAVYWFHPLAWIAASRAAAAREAACDEAVLALGVKPSTYARLLLDFAGRAGGSRGFRGALAIAQRSHLERRLITILKSDARASGRRGILLPAAAAAVMLAVTAIRPVAQELPAVSVPGLPGVPAASPLTGHLWTADISPASNTTVHRSGETVATRVRTPATVLQLQGEMPCASTGLWTSGNGGTTITDTIGDVHVCFRADDQPSMRGTRPSEVVRSTGRFMLETRQSGGATLRLSRARSGDARVTWQVNGTERPVDTAVEAWRDRLLALLDTTYEMYSLQGEVASLQGAIASVQGQRASLEGQILQAEAASMQGQLATIQGRIATVKGQANTIETTIATERGAIASLRDAQVILLEQKVRDLEAQLRNFGTEARAAQAQGDVTSVNADGKVQTVQRQIEADVLASMIADARGRIQALNVDRQVATLNHQLSDLNAERRISELQTRRNQESERLRDAIRNIK